MSSVYFPAQVSTDKEIRDASIEANKKLEDFSVEQRTREDLYKAVQEYIENNPQEVKALQGEDRRLLEKLMQSFTRNGLALELSKRQRVKEIKQKIGQLAIKFQQNLNEDTTKVWFTRAELEGLPDEFVEGLPKENGKYAVSLKYPELLPTMKLCKVEETRKKMRFASNAKCMKENTPMYFYTMIIANIYRLEEILVLRQEEASLLGYKDHASYELEIKMAKTTDTVFNFLEDLTKRLEKPAKKEIDQLLKLKKQEKEKRGEPFDNALHIWDLMYYHNMLLETEYQINQELIKEYFPLQKVTDGMLSIFADMLGLRIQEISGEKSHTWHKDAKQFEVHDKQSGQFMGHLYLDLFPRDGKYGHAAEFDLLKGFTSITGERQYPAAALVANFNKPTATKPSLLRFDEVVTYFHELGHAMHELCTKAKYYRFAGTNVERDFVEAPSQMLENWVYNADVLQRISGHYLDNKSLPEDIRQKLIAAKNVNEAIMNRRQLHFGTFDMRVHTTKGPIDTAAAWAKSMKEIALFDELPGTNGAASFGHIVGGYSAGYYGYLWSKVYSCDMFDRFKKEGLFNKTIGKAYRDHILAVGGTKDSMEGLVAFLGRQPTSDAFLADIGALRQS